MIIKSLYLFGALIASQLELQIVTPSVCAALLVAGFVLVLCKQHIIGTAIITVSSAMLIYTFGGLLINSDSEKSMLTFYSAHLIPLLLIVILSVWMTVIAVRARVKLKRMYNKVSENIYNSYKINIVDGEAVDEEKWEEFLEKFDPTDYNSQFVSNEEESE